MKIAYLTPQNPLHLHFAPRLQQRLAPHTFITWKQGQPAPAHDFDVILCIGRIRRELLQAQPRLKLLLALSAGYELIDLQAATERGIRVSNAPSHLTGNAESVAEHALLLMMGAANQMHNVLAHLARGVNPPLPRPALAGKHVCLLGLGAIAHQLATRLQPFGVRLSALNRSLDKAPAGVPTRPLAERCEAVRDVDFLVVCLAATAETENIVDDRLLAALPQGAILVNIARGSLVDEDALLRALQSGHLAAAGLDVLRQEPPDPAHPLLHTPQAFITPHLAGGTELMVQGTIDFAAATIEKLQRGEPIPTQLNDV